MPEIRTTSSTGGEKGTKLPRFDLIPPGPHRELAEHYGRGARKYADNQWRNGYEWSKSIAAIGRHFNDFMAGKDYDVCSNDPDGCSFIDADGEPFEPFEPDTCFNHTGSHHMAAVAWHSFLLLEFKDTHPQHDDRYKPEPDCCASHDEIDDEPQFPGRVWVGPPLVLEEDGWEQVGWTDDAGWVNSKTSLQDRINDLHATYYPEGVPAPGWTHDQPGAFDIAYREPARFVAGGLGSRDLKNPLPLNVERAVDDGMMVIGFYGNQWYVGVPGVFEFSIGPGEHEVEWPSEIHRSIYQEREEEIGGYIAEYRDLLRKHAPAIDAVGEVL